VRAEDRRRAVSKKVIQVRSEKRKIRQGRGEGYARYLGPASMRKKKKELEEKTADPYFGERKKQPLDLKPEKKNR